MIEDFDEPYYGESAEKTWKKEESNAELLRLIYSGSEHMLHKNNKHADAYFLMDLEEAVKKEISIDPWRVINR